MNVVQFIPISEIVLPSSLPTRVLLCHITSMSFSKIDAHTSQAQKQNPRHMFLQ